MTNNLTSRFVALACAACLLGCESTTAPEEDVEPDLEPLTMEAFRPDVDAGGSMTCSLSAEGAIHCWGYTGNSWASGKGPNAPQKALDEAWPENRYIPLPVDSAPPFARIAVGALAACGLAEDGQVYCWGRNDTGYLGDGTLEDRFWAAPVATEVRFTRFAALASPGHFCALTLDGAAYCWGGHFHSSGVPNAIPGDQRFRMLAAGGAEACGLTAGSKLYCWGLDGSGLTDTRRAEPTLVPTEMKFDTVVVGWASVCGLSDRVAYCRGWNGNGSMGSGDTISSAEFTPVETHLRFRSISHGRVHVCALTDAGEAYCWGAGTSGRLGNGTEEKRLVPTPVAGGHRFLKLAAGGDHTCAMEESGALYCWGEGLYGVLGTGNGDDSLVPVQVLMPVGGGS